MANKIKVGIIGGAGYTGGELLRLLVHHPHVQLAFATSRSQAGKNIQEVHPDLWGSGDLQFSLAPTTEVEVLFLCLPHKESLPWLKENPISDKTKIIDLGNDFRLDGVLDKRHFVYGMPELYKEQIKKADAIANCGCFAAALQYGLLPLARHSLLNKVYSTGITGSTGAGVKPSPTTHYSWRNNNISAYKTLTHQHIDEIQLHLKKMNENPIAINFVPWRGDFARGIFISSTLEIDKPLDELYHLYEAFYAGSPFVQISKKPIHMKQIVNTNHCVLQLEKKGKTLVVHSALDNLLKGASGQAVQNMNLMMGWDETAGLILKPSAY